MSAIARPECYPYCVWGRTVRFGASGRGRTMLKTRVQIWVPTLAAVVVGYLQASSLAHILTDSLPYKEMRFPPASIYVSAAQTILWLGPLGAAAVAIVTARTQTSRLAGLFGTFAAPLLGWLVVAIQSFQAVAPRGYVDEAHDFNRTSALSDFTLWCVVAIVLGCLLVTPTLLTAIRQRRRNRLDMS